MSEGNVIERVRRALGRTGPVDAPPAPPVISEPITRLVHSEVGLAELFAKRAEENKMGVEGVYVEALADKLIAFLRANKCRRIALPVSPLLEKMNVPAALKKADFDVRCWDGMTLDEVYDVDCGVTDVWAAVAETGSVVIRAAEGHGRSLSLVPQVHVAVIEPKNFIADLVDLFEKLAREGVGSSTVVITGPSKTSDIEMNLVTGVHGPMIVQLFILR